MDRDISIGAERPEDGPLISNVVLSAYANVVYSDHREHLMVERLRGTDAYIPALSLLAEMRNEAVGHILLTRVHIGSGDLSVPALALAPLSVVPEAQSRGVGKQLVGAAHRRAAELGFRAIVLVGIPSYYPQFGYERLSRYPIILPFDAPDDNCMILPLASDALDGVTGMVHYAEGWLEH
jgi:predicted N-acetyltransferase YhbS